MKKEIPVSMMGESESILAKYFQLIKSGTSPRMAEILACRKAPGLETDTSHYAGMKPLEETCGQDYARKTKAQARAAGISITDNSIYNATIADERGGGDPKAWLLAGDGRAKFRDIVNNHGASCESLKVKENGKLLERFAKREKFVRKKLARKAEIKARQAEIAARG